MLKPILGLFSKPQAIKGKKKVSKKVTTVTSKQVRAAKKKAPKAAAGCEFC